MASLQPVAQNGRVRAIRDRLRAVGLPSDSAANVSDVELRYRGIESTDAEKILTAVTRTYSEFLNLPIANLSEQLRRLTEARDQAAAAGTDADTRALELQIHFIRVKARVKKFEVAVVDEPRSSSLPAESKPDTDPRKLFRALEARLVGARSVKVVADIEMRGGKSEADMQLTMLVAPGNMAKVTLRTSLTNKTELQLLTLVTDGRQTSLSSSSPPISTMRPARAQIQGQLTCGMAIGFSTVAALTFNGGTATTQDVEKDFTITDFRFGKSETIGGRVTSVIHYTVGRSNNLATLWLDTKTLLPVRWSATPKSGVGGRVFENYREFVLDTPIEPQTFELPPRGNTAGAHRRKG